MSVAVAEDDTCELSLTAAVLAGAFTLYAVVVEVGGLVVIKYDRDHLLFSVVVSTFFADPLFDSSLDDDVDSDPLSLELSFTGDNLFGRAY